MQVPSLREMCFSGVVVQPQKKTYFTVLSWSQGTPHILLLFVLACKAVFSIVRAKMQPMDTMCIETK